MLSYRHAFHAGNAADVLKHSVLLALLDHLNRKPKPWWFIDTHAGAGCYTLESEAARKTGDAQGGVLGLTEADDVPALVATYLDAVRQFNPQGGTLFYPGSPALAMQRARADDRLRLFELHPADAPALTQLFAGERQRVVVRQSDGFSALKGLLPPPTRRALICIDPAYEVKQDYERVVTVLRDALRRFATGMFLVWYPMLASSPSRLLPRRLRELDADAWLEVRLVTHAPSPELPGMFGSGLFIINPPWNLRPQLEASLPWLTRALARDDQAGFDLEDARL